MNTAYFGEFGGQFIPETLMNCVIELESAYNFYKNDKGFNAELDLLFKTYANRPSPLYHAKKLSADLGVKIYLKREDLNHTGSHKINNVLGQALLAKKMGKKRVIAGDGRRTARRGYGYGGGTFGARMRDFYGCGGLHSSGVKCLSYATFGRESQSREKRDCHAKRRCERDFTRMDYAHR